VPVTVDLDPSTCPEPASAPDIATRRQLHAAGYRYKPIRTESRDNLVAALRDGRNPFPGMNPYLERPGEWQSFHTQFIVDLTRALVPSLGDRYEARTEQTLFIHEPPASRRVLGRADVGASIGAAAAHTSGGVGVGAAAVAGVAPLSVDLAGALEVVRHRRIVIRTAAGDRVVTVIELLSPSNKLDAADRAQYLLKRRELAGAGVHVVQLDLLRAGPRLLAGEPPPPCAYCVTLARAERHPIVDLWPVGLRDRLPTVPVPLLWPDPDVRLDLQAVLDRTYDAAGYGPNLYRRPPDPPLDGPDAEWAAGRLAAVGVAT